MRKPNLAILAVVVVFACTILFVSCGKDKITQPQEDYVGNYHLFYNYISGEGTADDLAMALKFSTKTGEIVDTVKTPFIITNIRYTTDGSFAAYRVLDKSNNKTIISMDNITGDTLASTTGNYGGNLFFNPDENMLMAANYGKFAILSFPSLNPIYVEEIETLTGGFMTKGEKAFYMVQGVDSLFFIDYSNTENIIKTSEPMKWFGSPAFPVSAIVDHHNNRLILVCESGGDSAFIRVYDSNDFSFLKELNLHSRYKIKPVIRPGTDEVYLGSYSFPGTGFIDVYHFDTNILTSFLTSENVTVTGGFDPFQLEFTPDGQELFNLYGATIPPQGILGFKPNSATISKHFGPAQGYANGGLIRIDPIDHSK